MTWLAWAEDTSLPTRRRKAAADLPGVPAEIHVHRLMPADALRIRGRHNALKRPGRRWRWRVRSGLPLAPMLHALREYSGEPHRVELIASLRGVEYYDDSKGTNVGATVAALDGLGAEGRRLVVILGGDGKGQDFTPLAAPVARHARAVVLIGRDAALIRTALAPVASQAPVLDAETLEDAVRSAVELAQPGDAVLLSPACASLDMFRDYRHRAEVFVDAVRELAAESGAAVLKRWLDGLKPSRSRRARAPAAGGAVLALAGLGGAPAASTARQPTEVDRTLMAVVAALIMIGHGDGVLGIDLAGPIRRASMSHRRTSWCGICWRWGSRFARPRWRSRCRCRPGSDSHRGSSAAPSRCWCWC